MTALLKILTSLKKIFLFKINSCKSKVKISVFEIKISQVQRSTNVCSNYLESFFASNLFLLLLSFKLEGYFTHNKTTLFLVFLPVKELRIISFSLFLTIFQLWIEILKYYWFFKNLKDNKICCFINIKLLLK